MLFDMPTLLAMRVGIDVLIALAFWGQMRRYPAIGGPGWWALAPLLSIVGSIGLWTRGSAPDLLAYAVGNTALTLSPLLAWMGVRSFLQFSRPLGRMALFALAVLAGQVVFLSVWDLPQARQGMFALSVLAIMGLALRDMVRADPQRRVRSTGQRCAGQFRPRCRHRVATRPASELDQPDRTARSHG